MARIKDGIMYKYSIVFKNGESVFMEASSRYQALIYARRYARSAFKHGQRSIARCFKY